MPVEHLQSGRSMGKVYVQVAACDATPCTAVRRRVYASAPITALEIRLQCTQCTCQHRVVTHMHAPTCERRVSPAINHQPGLAQLARLCCGGLIPRRTCSPRAARAPARCAAAGCSATAPQSATTQHAHAGCPKRCSQVRAVAPEPAPRWNPPRPPLIRPPGRKRTWCLHPSPLASPAWQRAHLAPPAGG